MHRIEATRTNEEQELPFERSILAIMQSILVEARIDRAPFRPRWTDGMAIAMQSMKD